MRRMSYQTVAMGQSRRNFIKTAGCLTIGFCLGGRPYDGRYPGVSTTADGMSLPESLEAGLPGPGEGDRINSWLEVLSDGRVRVLTGKLELGQGIRTAVAQVAAEELDMEMSQVEVTMAETGVTMNEGYTAGSGSIENSAMAIRNAAATARQKLLELAAQKMNVAATELTVTKGTIRLKNGSRQLSFAELLDGRQLTDEVSMTATLKPKAAHRLVGKAIPRDDVPRMVAGEPIYVHDLHFPGMVYGRIIRPPSYDARLLQYNEQAVKDAVAGFIKMVVNGSFLGVIASSEYHAIRAQQLLRENSRWADGPALPKIGVGKLADYLVTLPVKSERVSEKGNMAGFGGVASGVALKARYFKPYIMHGATGPSCAIALYDGKLLHVWTHSQGVYPLRDTLAVMLQLSADNIHVKGVPGSGCYGHNGADDVAADAALLAMAYPGKHVKVQWSREDEHAWEPYGSAMIMKAQALLDGSGKISHWKFDLWSDTHGARPGGKANNLLPARYLEKPFTGRPTGFSGGAYRNSEPYYSIPNQQIDAHFFEGPLRTSSLRSLGAYANLFAIESFMDELAEKAAKDPYTFRLLHLQDERARAVLMKLQSISGGAQGHGGRDLRGVRQEQGFQTGMGIAFSRYENTKAYCAVAARVTVNVQTGAVRVQKMWAVIDAGEVINLDGIKNQVEGSMIQSASWTLLEQVHFDEKHVTSRNWDSYPLLRFGEIPEVEVVVLDRPEENPLGAGEAAQGPAAAAMVNAVYHACGKRVRSLPVVAAMAHANKS